MPIADLRAFFLWCTLVNAGLLLLSFLVTALAGGWVYRVHTRWYPMPRETFNVVIYSFLGVFKILVFVFNLVPYIALGLVG